MSFFPDFNKLSVEEGYKNFLERKLINDIEFDVKKARGEYYFIVDRSGSMRGDRI